MMSLRKMCQLILATSLSDENADLEEQEKSAKQLFDENADLITIKYTYL